MRRYSRFWRWMDRVTAILVLAAMICACPPARAEGVEPPPEETPAPQPIEDALPLIRINPDTVGWLQVGRIIDMPVVQRDNDYYLHHNFLGESVYAGTVFLDEECSILPRDEHLVLYGHNMRNGSVFGELDRYRDLKYLKANPIVSFDTIYEEGLYAVIAVFDISAETEDPDYLEMLTFNFEEDEFAEFMEEVRERSFYVIPVDIRHGDHLLTLVTCSYTLYDGRLILMLREIRDDEDPQEIAEAMQSTVRQQPKIPSKMQTEAPEEETEEAPEDE